MKTHQLDSRITSRAFRQAVLDVYPDAAYKPERMRLLLMLLLCPWVDADGRTVLDYSQLAACGNADRKSRNFKAADLLTDFEAHVTPLNLNGPQWRSKASLSRARTVLPVWPQTVLDALRAELETPMLRLCNSATPAGVIRPPVLAGIRPALPGHELV